MASLRHLLFRYRTAIHCDQPFSVMPLRVDLERFALSRSQKRVLAKNCDARIVLRPTAIDAEKDALLTFIGIASKRTFQFARSVLVARPRLSALSQSGLCVYHGEKLLAVTFLDVGQTATSAVYAMFNPAEIKRSLGILMMLHSIEFSRAKVSVTIIPVTLTMSLSPTTTRNVSVVWSTWTGRRGGNRM